MTINDVREVEIDAEGGYKFIVVCLTDGDENEKLVVRADENCSYHRDILYLLRSQLPSNITARCIGGGQILIDPKQKSIMIWGSSGDFGVEPDRTKTIELLQTAYPDYRVTEAKNRY